jgi:hypothetical protein
MIRPLLRSFTALAAAAALLAVVPAVSAQTNNVKKLTRLGAVAASAMHVPPLTNAASLKRLMAIKKMPVDFRKGFEAAGKGDLADEAIATLTSPSQVIKADNCVTATAPDASLPDGTLVECSVPVGTGMEWMMYRKKVAKGPRHDITLFQGIEWAGKRAFPAFAFRIVRKEGRTTRTYQFVLPKACSNLALLKTTEVNAPQPEHPLTPTVKSTCDCNTGKQSITISVSGDTANLRRVRVLVDGNAVGELTAPSWSMNGDRAGTYTFQAEGGADDRYPFSQSSIRVDPCPPPQKVAQTCSVKLTHVEGKKGVEFMIDASGTTSGSPNVPATTVVQLYGPTGAAIGQPITLSGDMKTTVTVPFKKAEGTYKVTATTTSPDTVADCKHYGGKDSCEATDTYAPPPSTASIFVDGLFGKERRQRPASEYDLSAEQLAALGLTSATAADTLFGQCSPLLGFKVGYAKRFKNDWELAGDGGVAFNLSSGQLGNDVDKINPVTVLAEVEGNKYLKNDAFVGTGLSFWDLTRSETFTPAWLVHFGIPIGHNPRRPVYFIAEGRLFFDNIDSVDNNYNFWGGIRIHFKR